MPPQRPESSVEDDLREPLLLSSSSSTRPTGHAADASSPTTIRRQVDDDDDDRLDPRRQRRQEKARRNVRATLAYAAVAFTGSSIWGNSVLATYVYLLAANDDGTSSTSSSSSSNSSARAVGFVTGVMGVANAVTSGPAGYAADVLTRRDVVLRAASCVRAVAIGSTLYAITSSSHHHHHDHDDGRRRYRWLCAALALWGGSRGAANAALGALFADSVPRGRRGHHFTRRTQVRTLGTLAGPLVSLTLFAVLGDEWTVHACAVVLVAGQLISVGTLVILCLFDDDGALPEEPEQRIEQQQQQQQQQQQPLVHSTAIEEEQVRTCPSLDRQRDDSTDHHEVQPMAAEYSSHETDPDDTTAPQSTLLCYCANLVWLYTHRRIPVLVCLADMMLGLASGISIRFFPIFFVDNLSLGPVVVQVLYILSPLLQTALMNVSQRLSLRHGRCHVSVAFRWAGVTLMFVLIAAYLAGAPVWCVCVVYVVRTGVVNATRALTRSLLMDHVPAAERGRWSAMESVNTLSWSGSAVVGGLLVGAVGLLPLFAATACLQFAATLPLVVLFDKDSAEEEGSEEEGQDYGGANDETLPGDPNDSSSPSASVETTHRHID